MGTHKKACIRCFSYRPVAWLVAILMVLPSSCVVATRKTGTVVVEKADTLLKGKYETAPRFEELTPRTVAILPFLNETTKEEAPDVVRRCFYNHFSSLPYLDREMFLVDSTLRRSGITDAEQVQKITPQQYGELLRVDAVIYGVATHYDRWYLVVASDVAVGARLRMMDTRTGELLWQGEHVAHMPTGGIATNPVGLILTALSTAYNLRTINLYRTSDDLFREMVKAIPRIRLAEAEAPPAITALVQDGAFSVKKAGDVIQVAMEGDSHMRAYFDIGEFKKGLHMREVSPGNYLGEYRVIPGDNVSKALVTGYLTNDAGITTEWVDALGYVTLDTTPPAPPSKPAESSRDGALLLAWPSNAESDLAGYRVYRSDTPLTGYALRAEVEETEYLDSGLDNLKPYYYRLTAVDHAGNESDPSPNVRGMGVRKGPTTVQGELKENTSWYAAAGPYILEGWVTVPDKMTLTIEAGAVVLGKTSGIRVQGALRAVGSSGRVIAFRGQGKEPWAGLVLEGRGSSDLEFCSIQGAETGLHVRSGAVTVRHCELSRNRTGLAVEGVHAKVLVEDSKIIENSADGVTISSGAEPVLRRNRIAGNGGAGLRAAASSPILEENQVLHNKGGGVRFREANPKMERNSVHDNESHNLLNEAGSQTVRAAGNYWGAADGAAVIAGIKGRVDFNPVLDGAPPGGKPVVLSILESSLEGTVSQDSFLVLSHSPYLLAGELVVEGGALLHIEPGVHVTYQARHSKIVVKNGAVHARGLPEAPILFVSASSSPGPGDYVTAVQFDRARGGGVTGQVLARVDRILGKNLESYFAYCVFAHAETPLDIHGGRPDITYSFIGWNRQSGIICRNDSRPNIVRNTFFRNSGTAAIECFGSSNPRIQFNNVSENPFAIQSFSSITLDARSNWWGSPLPDAGLFLGNVEYIPFLTEPEAGAFQYAFGTGSGNP